MTLNKRNDKKNTSIEFSGTTDERKAVEDLLKKVRERMVYDVDEKRQIKKNERAIVPTNDPILYAKLDGFLEALAEAIGSNRPSVNIDMGPNEFSDSTGDKTTNRLYSDNLAKNLREFEQAIEKPEGMRTFDSYTRFKVKGVLPLSSIDLDGKDIRQLMKDPKAVVPEYGQTTVGKGFLGMEKKGLSDSAWTVVVKDNNELIDAEDITDKIKLDGSKWKKFIGGLSMLRYQKHGKLTPKNKLRLLEAGIAKAIGQANSVIGVVPIRSPIEFTSEDPDSPGKKSKYWIFTFAANSGGIQSASQRDLVKKMIESETLVIPDEI